MQSTDKTNSARIFFRFEIAQLTIWFFHRHLFANENSDKQTKTNKKWLRASLGTRKKVIIMTDTLKRRVKKSNNKHSIHRLPVMKLQSSIILIIIVVGYEWECAPFLRIFFFQSMDLNVKTKAVFYWNLCKTASIT